MRKVFLDELPRWRFGKGQEDGFINWKECIGKKINFIYDDICGELEIIKYTKGKLQLNYKNRTKSIGLREFYTAQIGNILGVHTKDFKIEIGTELKDEKRDLTIIDRFYGIKNKNKQVAKWYKYKCNKCGYDEGWVIESALLRGNGCSCCCHNPQVTIKGINDLATTHPWMIPYFVNIEDCYNHTYSSGDKVLMKCPDCGKIKDNKVKIYNLYNKKSIGCSCGDGIKYPEKFMMEFLNQLGIKYTYQYMPEWIKPKRYDFYFELNNKKYIIETDGSFHKKDNTMSGQTKKESEFVDNEKDRLAIEHDIKVLRIKTYESDIEYIKNKILESNLNELFDLSNIDWIKCEEFALKNIVKEVCKYWSNKKENEFTSDLEKYFKISRTSIITYLKKGTKIWNWCYYNAKEEKRRSDILVGEKSKNEKSNRIKAYLDGNLLEDCYSKSELVRVFKNKYNIKIDIRGINDSITKCKSYKGFTFELGIN